MDAGVNRFLRVAATIAAHSKRGLVIATETIRSFDI